MSLTKVTNSMIVGASANVLDYGADKTGVADSTAAFTAAGSSASRVQVIIPAGVYKLNSNPAPTGYVTWVVLQGASFTGAGTLPTPTEATGNIAAYSGTYKSIESDPSFYGGMYGYLERWATQTFHGVTGVQGATQSADGVGNPGESRIGVAAFGANNFVGPNIGVWGMYTTVVRESGAMGATQGIELDIANMGATVPIFPADMFKAGSTLAVWIASGGEPSNPIAGGSPGAASCAIGIIRNDGQAVPTASFDKGIVFHNSAISGTDGATGNGVAIAFSTRQGMLWFNNLNQPIAEIVANGTTAANTNTRLNFSDFGLLYENRSSGKALFSVGNSATAVNQLSVIPSNTGVAPKLQAAGDDANIDLTLEVKGIGACINFQNVSSPPTAGAATGYLLIKVNGGERKIPLYDV